MRLRTFLCTLAAIMAASMGCSDSPVSPSEAGAEGEAWVRYTPFRWSHDGDPYRSTHFTIYSDGASTAMKARLAEIADESFDQILTLFDFQRISDFRFPPGYSHMEIYLNRAHEESVNWAYWGGFIFTLRSSEISGRWLDYTVYTVRHESTHDFEFLIEGREWLSTDVWFKEGIATHVGCLESTPFTRIRSVSELESWIGQNRNVPGRGNPISIHRDEDYPDGADRHQYYRLFELAVAYILDQSGMDRTFDDVVAMFYDLREGTPFASSFERRFEISVGALEEDVFERLTAYLRSADVPQARQGPR